MIRKANTSKKVRKNKLLKIDSNTYRIFISSFITLLINLQGILLPPSESIYFENEEEAKRKWSLILFKLKWNIVHCFISTRLMINEFAFFWKIYCNFMFWVNSFCCFGVNLKFKLLVYDWGEVWGATSINRKILMLRAIGGYPYLTSVETLAYLFGFLTSFVSNSDPSFKSERH